MTVARPGLSLAEAKRNEWMHGQRCHSVDCAKCRDLADDVYRAEAEVNAERQVAAGSTPIVANEKARSAR